MRQTKKSVGIRIRPESDLGEPERRACDKGPRTLQPDWPVCSQLKPSLNREFSTQSDSATPAHAPTCLPVNSRCPPPSSGQPAEGLFYNCNLGHMPIRHARLDRYRHGQRHGQPACNRGVRDCRLCLLVPSSVVSRLSRVTCAPPPTLSKVRQPLGQQTSRPACIAVPCMRLDACHSSRPPHCQQTLFPSFFSTQLRGWLTGGSRRPGGSWLCHLDQ